MFFCPELLKKRRHPFFLVWMASTQHGRSLKKYINSRTARGIDMCRIVRDILRIVVTNFPQHVPRPFPKKTENFSLYLSSKLMYGCCVLFRKQADILFADLQDVFKNMKEIRKINSRDNKHNQDVEQQPDPDLTFRDIDFTQLNENIFFDEEPLVFTNSVTHASVTMEEDVIPLPLPEDFGFGDEGNDYCLQILIGQDRTESGNVQGHLTEMLPDQLSHQRLPDQLSHLRPVEIGADTPDVVPELEPPSKTPPAVPQELVNPPEAQESITAQAQADAICFQNEIFEDFQFEMQPTNNLPAELDQPSVTCPSATGNIVSDADLVIPLPDVENEVLGAADQTCPRGVLHEDPQKTSDSMELLDLPPRLPRRRKYPQHLIIDDCTKIPSGVMIASLDNKGADTLRKESIYNEAMSRFIRSKWLNLSAMGQQGRGGSLNKGLQKLFSRHLVTRSAPTDNQPLPFCKAERVEVKMESTRAEVSAAKGQRSLLMDQFSRTLTATQEFELLDHGMSSSALKENFLQPSVALDTIDVDPSSQHVDMEIGQDHAEDDSKKTKRKRENRLKLDDGDTTTTHPKKRKTVTSDKPAAASCILKMPGEQGHDLMEAGAPELFSELADIRNGTEQGVPVNTREQETHTQAEMSGPRVEGGLEMASSASKQAEFGIAGEQAIVPSLEMQTGLEEMPQFEAIEQNTYGESLQCSLSSHPIQMSEIVNDVLLKSSELANAKNVNTFSIEGLCPVASTRRPKAARMFSALLDLHQKKKVELHQDRNGDAVEPIFITVLNIGETV